MLDSFYSINKYLKKSVYPQHQVRKGITVVFYPVHQFFVFLKKFLLLSISINLFLLCQTLERSHGVGWIFLSCFLYVCLFLLIRFYILDECVHPLALFILCKTLSLSPIPHFVIPLNCFGFSFYLL